MTPKLYDLKITSRSFTGVLAQVKHICIVESVHSISHCNSRSNVMKELQIDEVGDILDIGRIVIFVHKKAVCLCVGRAKVTELLKDVEQFLLFIFAGIAREVLSLKLIELAPQPCSHPLHRFSRHARCRL